MLKSIGCFSLTASQPSKTVFNLSKTPKYKTIGCFDKTTGYFSLSLKNTFLLKGLRMLKLWIQSIVDLTHKIYPKSYLKTAQQQQAHPVFHQPSKGLDSSKFEHT